MRKLAMELMHLVYQIKRLGLTQELSESAIDGILEAVANGGEVPVPVPRSMWSSMQNPLLEPPGNKQWTQMHNLHANQHLV